MEYMMYIITFLGGMLIGWWYREARAKAVLARLIEEEANAAIEEATKRKDFRAYMKKDGDIYYVYDEDSGQFLVQGKNKKDIETNLAKRFPGAKVWIGKDNAKDVGFL